MGPADDGSKPGRALSVRRFAIAFSFIWCSHWGVANLRPATPSERTFKMPSVEVSAPAISPACDRLVLGVGWVRPGAAGIGGTLNPSAWILGGCSYGCFEGNED